MSRAVINFLTDYKDCTTKPNNAKYTTKTQWPTYSLSTAQNTDQKRKQETSGQVTGQQNEAKSTVTLKYSDQFTGWYNQAR